MPNTLGILHRMARKTLSLISASANGAAVGIIVAKAIQIKPLAGLGLRISWVISAKTAATSQQTEVWPS